SHAGRLRAPYHRGIQIQRRHVGVRVHPPRENVQGGPPAFSNGSEHAGYCGRGRLFERRQFLDRFPPILGADAVRLSQQWRGYRIARLSASRRALPLCLGQKQWPTALFRSRLISDEADEYSCVVLKTRQETIFS